MTAYQTLETHFTTMNALDGAMAVLHWDNAVMMPSGGAAVRGDQLATLTTVIHGIITGPEIPKLLSNAERQEEDLDDWQNANLREMRRQWTHAAAVNSKIFAALSRATTECEHVWRYARAANDFKTFAPQLKKVLALVREIAQIKASHLGCSLYDALLDNYDPGRTSAEIDVIFADLAKFLPDFIGQVLEHQKSQPAPLPLSGHFPIENQKKLGMNIMRLLGFDFEYGRLDVSHHPFCGGVPSDVRITTRYYEHDFLPSLLGVIHETGHALYENHLPDNWRHQPVGKAQGMSIHESQSLIMEMQACRTREFLSFLQPHITAAFGVSGDVWTVENVTRSINLVERSLIRVDSDEVTYPAHIMLRYRLEKAMINGDLTVDDLPGAWNDGMQELLGITPDSDKDGCMQDIHWPGGDFGYFPTYTLGAINAAQLFTAAKKAHPELLGTLGKGDFTVLGSWLSEHVHSKGSFYGSANRLMQEATGKTIDVENYKKHLRARYLNG